MTTTRNMMAETINDYLADCNGSEGVSKYGGRWDVTSGVLFVAETANCFWLLDVIFSHQGNHKAIRAACGLQVWRIRLNKTGNGCRVTMDDGGRCDAPRVLIAQRIPYTDFPRGVDVVMYLENCTLMLAEER